MLPRKISPSQLDKRTYSFTIHMMNRIIRVLFFRIQFFSLEKFSSAIEGAKGGEKSMDRITRDTGERLIFEIGRETVMEARRGRLVTNGIQEGNMCKIIRNCSPWCRLNPISPLSISSHRAGYSPFRWITLPHQPLSNLYSTRAHLLNNAPADYRVGLYLAVRANHRRLTAALWIFLLPWLTAH